MTVETGFRGIWYANQPREDEYRFKYSGGFATYPQQHAPIAIYSREQQKTFFVLGGRSERANTLLNLVSYYDHRAGTVARPTAVLARDTFDAHFNASLAIDDAGHLYVFCNSHGQGGELPRSDPTYGHAYIFRSRAPYDVRDFELVRRDNFSYSNVWNVPGRGLVWLHTRYDDFQRPLYVSSSVDGLAWREPAMLGYIEQGMYQVSWAHGRRVSTAFDFHPHAGGLNARTNLYYLYSDDVGATWRSIDGAPVALPLARRENPALIADFAARGLLVYLKDLNVDADGRPIVLYLTTRSHVPGPAAGPRTFNTARWTGGAWEHRPAFTCDHNYDHGSLYVEPDGTWRIIAPSLPGPQPHATGGDVAAHVSRDRGATWTIERAMPRREGFNQTYVRRPLHAHDDFYALWADGNALRESASRIYFSNRAGDVFQLPTDMAGEHERPIAIR